MLRAPLSADLRRPVARGAPERRLRLERWQSTGWWSWIAVALVGKFEAEVLVTPVKFGCLPA